MNKSRFGYLVLVASFFIVFVIFVAFGPALHAADLYTFIDEEGNTYYTNIPGEGRMRVPLPVKKTISEPLFKNAQNGVAYEPMIVTASQRYSVDPNLVRAVIKAESNFNHRAVSPRGALGLMQLMPETAQKMTVTNPFNPEENIHGGVRYLSELLHLFNWNLPLALAAYNAGPERVIGRNEIPPIEETRNYVRRVRMYYRDFKESFLMYK
jgi:soluble lytic murein transglycosylase-like protein